MKTRRLSVTKAIGYLKDSESGCTMVWPPVSFWTHPRRIGRPQIHPNYGFLRQLYTFAACNYDPTPRDPAYRTWKRRQAQDVNHFLNIMSDTTTVIPDQLMMSRSVMILFVWSRPYRMSISEFTEDLEEAQWLLHDMKISHVVSACSSVMHIAKELESLTTCRYFDIPDNDTDALMVALRRICDFLHNAIRNGGRVLVYCSSESRASTIVCAYRELPDHLPLK